MEQRNSSESLARSHSASSNAKLTLLCLLSAAAFSGAWGFIALLGTALIPGTVAIIGLVACVAVSVLCFLGISKFKR